MSRLLWELEQLGVPHLHVEARQREQDNRDRRLLDQLRAGRILDGRLRMDHLPGPKEPLLWIADAIAGAVVAARQGDPRFRTVIDHQIREVRVE